MVAAKRKCLLVFASQHYQSTPCNVSDMNAADRKEWVGTITNILLDDNSETSMQHFSAQFGKKLVTISTHDTENETFKNCK